MFKKLYLIIPLIIFAIIFTALWKGLKLQPTKVPSPLINKPAPQFQVANLFYPEKISTDRDLIGRVTLLNVWATWCYACAQEHDFLLQLAKDEYLNLYGLNYKDNPIAAKDWLLEKGNPYKIVGLDPKGNVAIDWGVYGTPETFIIDKKGVIRYKQIGPITPEVWNRELKPLIDRIRKE